MKRKLSEEQIKELAKKGRVRFRALIDSALSEKPDNFLNVLIAEAEKNLSDNGSERLTSAMAGIALVLKRQQDIIVGMANEEKKEALVPSPRVPLEFRIRHVRNRDGFISESIIEVTKWQ